MAAYTAPSGLQYRHDLWSSSRKKCGIKRSNVINRRRVFNATQ
ncbi:hypothetical protein ACFOGG_02055 [Brenneria rubrifaciens]